MLVSARLLIVVWLQSSIWTIKMVENPDMAGVHDTGLRGDTGMERFLLTYNQSDSK